MRTMVRSSFFALNESQSGKIGNNLGLVSSDCQAPVWGEDFTVSIPGWINSQLRSYNITQGDVLPFALHTGRHSGG